MQSTKKKPDIYNPKQEMDLNQLLGKTDETDAERIVRQKAEVEQREIDKELKKQRSIEKTAALNAASDDPDYELDTDDYWYGEHVKEIIDKIETDMVGMKPVKDRIEEIASMLVIDKMRVALGLETSVPGLHMAFTGSPGTGKTTIALRMGEILQRMGYCRDGHVVLATRDDLVGEFVGQTSPKTRDVVKKALGGILLIDEAYYLYNAENDRDFGVESIEVLLKAMEEQEDVIIIIAGYKDKIDRFYGFVPGFKSRIGLEIDFPDYNGKEMVEIAKVFMRDGTFEPQPGVWEKLEEYLEARAKLPFFANARTVRNAVDFIRMRQALRVYEEMEQGDGYVTSDDMSTLKPADVPGVEELKDDTSAIFQEKVENYMDPEYYLEDPEYPWELDHMHWRHDPEEVNAIKTQEQEQDHDKKVAKGIIKAREIPLEEMVEMHGEDYPAELDRMHYRHDDGVLLEPREREANDLASEAAMIKADQEWLRMRIEGSTA
jgi:probable Rubsico expression protein CbbX